MVAKLFSSVSLRKPVEPGSTATTQQQVKKKFLQTVGKFNFRNIQAVLGCFLDTANERLDFNFFLFLPCLPEEAT